MFASFKSFVEASHSFGQQNETIHAVHIGFGITDARKRSTFIKQVCPFISGQRFPLAFCVAAVANGIVALVGLPTLVIQIVCVFSVCIVVATVHACAPRLVANSTMIVAACTPAEEVDPA